MSVFDEEKRSAEQREALDAYLEGKGQAPVVTLEAEKQVVEAFVDAVFRELPNHYHYLEKDPSRQEMYSYLQSILTKAGVPHQSHVRELVARHVLNDMYNYPTAWQKVMDDNEIYEIKMYASNDHFEGQATIRRMYTKGVIDRSELILSEEQLERFLKRKWVGTGYVYDPTKPSSQGIFPDGSRVHVRHGSVGYTVTDEQGRRLVKKTIVITVRKFPRPIDLPDSVEMGHISEAIKVYLALCGQLKEGPLFAGPTGSGKSTLFGAWLGTLPHNDEVCVIEDEVTDLQPLHPRVSRLWTRNANSENRGGITLENNVTEILRMNSDHHALGETRTGPAASMLIQLKQSAKGIASTTLHMRTEGNGKQAARRFLNLLRKSEPGTDAKQHADDFTDAFQHLVITDDTDKGLRVRYVYEIGEFDWDTSSLPIYLIASWDEENDTFLFHGVTKRFASRAKRLGVTLTLPVAENPQVETVRL